MGPGERSRLQVLLPLQEPARGSGGGAVRAARDVRGDARGGRGGGVRAAPPRGASRRATSRKCLPLAGTSAWALRKKSSNGGYENKRGMRDGIISTAYLPAQL